MINKRTTKKIVNMAKDYFADVLVDEDGTFCRIAVFAGYVEICSVFINKKGKRLMLSLYEKNLSRMKVGYGLKCEWRKAVKKFAETCCLPFATKHGLSLGAAIEGEVCLI